MQSIAEKNKRKLELELKMSELWSQMLSDLGHLLP